MCIHEGLMNMKGQLISVSILIYYMCILTQAPVLKMQIQTGNRSFLAVFVHLTQV